MKVKVTYTVDYEDVPNLTNEIVSKCRADLKRCAEFNFDFTRPQKTEEVVMEVQTVLDLVSSQLEDCLGLVRGYTGYQTNLEEEQHGGEDVTQSHEG
tara:strand:- start:208 stop:498 length:291 start_codon:yes stop_codon:yes gene_type:complete